MKIILYHGSDYLFNKFLFKNVGKKSGTSGAGFGLYFTTSKADALCYGKYLYTVEVDLKKEISNTRKTLNRKTVTDIILEFDRKAENKYKEMWDQKETYSSIVNNLFNYSNSDTDIINDIINATNEQTVMMNILKKYGITHTTDKETPEDPETTNYCIYDLDCIKILKREKPLDDLTESIIEHHKLLMDDLFEMETIIGPMFGIPQSLTSLSDNMQRQARTKTLSQAQGRAKSKSQRRLFAMALAYKRGKLPAKYASETIKKLSKSIDQQTLHDFAKTDQKKRRKDGSIGKRNNIPEYVKGSKYSKKNK